MTADLNELLGLDLPVNLFGDAKAATHLQSITENLAGVEDCIDTFGQKCFGPIQATADDVSNWLANLQVEAEAEIESELQTAVPILHRVGEKMFSRAQGLLSSAYAALAPLGITYEADDVVAARLLSGIYDLPVPPPPYVPPPPAEPFDIDAALAEAAAAADAFRESILPGNGGKVATEDKTGVDTGTTTIPPPPLCPVGTYRDAAGNCIPIETGPPEKCYSTSTSTTTTDIEIEIDCGDIDTGCTEPLIVGDTLLVPRIPLPSNAQIKAAVGAIQAAGTPGQAISGMANALRSFGFTFPDTTVAALVGAAANPGLVSGSQIGEILTDISVPTLICTTTTTDGGPDCPPPPDCPPCDPCEEKKEPPPPPPRPCEPPDWCDSKLKADSIKPSGTKAENLFAASKVVEWQEDPTGFLTLIGWAKDAVDATAGASKVASAVVQSVINGVAGVVGDLITNALGGADACVDGCYITKTLLMDVAAKWIGLDLPWCKQPYVYYQNFLSPYLLPSADDATAAYLGGGLTCEQWELLQKSNGHCLSWKKDLLVSQRSKASPSELLFLNRYGKLSDDEYREKIAKRGFLDNAELTEWEAAQEAVPGVSDVVRMMVRDVADAGVVSKFNLDQGFSEKYTERVEAYGKANGLSKEIALDYWRAHWNYSSPTQSFEMLHRLRPGAPGVTDTFTDADLTELLNAQDYPDYFAKRLQAISYHPLTRVDAQRAFNGGELTEEEYQGVLQDGGYKEDDAKKLITFAKRERRDSLAAEWGVKSSAFYADKYERGEFGEDEVRQVLSDRKADEDDVEYVMNDLKFRRELYFRDQRMNCFKNQFLHGAIPDEQLYSKFHSEGFPVDAADKLIELWKCQREANAKNVTAGELCKMRERGLITPQEQALRLVRIGYSREDAEIVATNCYADISERAIRAFKQEMKAAEAAREKEKREKEKEERRQAQLAACGPPKIKCPK